MSDEKKVVILNDNAVLGELDKILLEQEEAEEKEKENK